MLPFFSIIIPVYNIAPYLSECLDSVLAQTFGDWECICVDDGSTDGSGAILDEYAMRDARFRVSHQQNAGVGAARNSALDIAQGEWVWFVDGDDAIQPMALELVMQAVRVNSTCNTVALGSIHGMALPETWEVGRQINAQFWPTAVDEATRLFLHGICFYVFRRQAIGGQRFPPFRHNEDGVFLYDYIPRGLGIVDLRERVYFNRTRQGSATHPIKISAEMVRRIMETRRLQVESLSRLEASIGVENMHSCWKRIFDNCFCGVYFGWYYQLPPHERCELFPEWLSLVKSCRRHYTPLLEQRIRFDLIRFFSSGRLVGRFAVGWVPGLQSGVRLLYFMRRKMESMLHNSAKKG